MTIASGTTYWFSAGAMNDTQVDTGGSLVMTTPTMIQWQRDGQVHSRQWHNPPEAIVRQAVDLAHRQQWDELAVLVKLTQAM